MRMRIRMDLLMAIRSFRLSLQGEGPTDQVIRAFTFGLDKEFPGDQKDAEEAYGQHGKSHHHREEVGLRAGGRRFLLPLIPSAPRSPSATRGGCEARMLQRYRQEGRLWVSQYLASRKSEIPDFKAAPPRNLWKMSPSSQQQFCPMGCSCNAQRPKTRPGLLLDVKL